MSRGTLDPARCFKISSTGLSPSTAGFPKTIRLSLSNANCSPQPRRTRSFGLASFPFARRYLGNRVFFLFLGVLRCFSSPGLPHLPMDSVSDSRFFIYWVSPFGHLGLSASYRLIQAFRRLARPSSPLIAKASTLYA